MSCLEDLARVAGAEEPRRFMVPWDEVEQDLGLSLPPSYRDFVYHFGPGVFGNYLTINVPGVENSFTELVWRARRLAAVFQERGEEFSRGFARSLYPQAGGALLFGTTVMGENLYWLTGEHDPERWHIVFEEPHESAWIVYSGGVSELLFKLFTREIAPDFLNVDFDAVPPFVPGDGSFRGRRGERLSAKGRFAD